MFDIDNKKKNERTQDKVYHLLFELSLGVTHSGPNAVELSLQNRDAALTQKRLTVMLPILSMRRVRLNLFC